MPIIVSIVFALVLTFVGVKWADHERHARENKTPKAIAMFQQGDPATTGNTRASSFDSPTP